MKLILSLLLLSLSSLGQVVCESEVVTDGESEAVDPNALMKRTPLDGRVMAGADGAVMKCIFNNTKRPEGADAIEWFFENEDGSEVKMSETFISITEEGASKIIVPNEEVKQGTYLCR